MNVEHPCLSPWKGAVIGGVIAFVWLNVSWVALPFHGKTMSHVVERGPLVGAMRGAQSGIHIFSNDPSGVKAPEAPFMFIAYHEEGWGTLARPMLLSLLTLGICGFFWTWVLGKIPGLTSRDAALYGAMFGLSAGCAGVLHNWVWWRFPFLFSLLSVVDLVVSWSVASVVIARWGRASVCALPPNPGR